ncbi:uncharacterized protein [Atheta coriaria]|uniref:uncharacterized protein n=1 Tax=Dalotia coriaria TaxID=877792 RepID=UPI0031F349F1
MHLKLCIFLLVAYSPMLISSEESQFSINNNKAIQYVNEKFISFSVDPAVFFSRLPHRDILFKLITHLSPAYLRVAGSSTQFLEFSADERKATKIISDDSTTLTFSPAMWWSLNEWMQKTNFTPIFGINDDAYSSGEKWDPKRVLPLLDMTARMNINCWWQIGFDCSQKGFERYKEDLKTFRKILDAFPAKKDKWQIVGSDLSKCTPSDHPEILRMYLADLDDADTIVWEEDESIISNFLSGGVMETMLGFHQATVPICLSTSKSQHPIGFEDGINWAVEIGEAARKGFSVIFREPRLQEYYSATPAYWVTVLHKSLMGRNVLDVKSTSLTQSTARIYAHCARDQNSFSVRGALTIMIVNNGTEAHKAAFRIPTQLKSVEVRSYTLTSSENTTDTYLNNEKLSLDNFKLLPKLRRAKVLTHLILTAPAKSISFFVLPGAKIPICIDNEDDTAMILEEIDRIQAVDFTDSGKSAEGLLSRLNAPRVSVSLADLHRKLQEEFKTDASLVPKLKLKSHLPTEDWKQLSGKIAQKIEPNSITPMPGMHGIKHFNFLLDKTKSDVKPVKNLDFKNLLKKDNERKDDILGSALKPNSELKTHSKPTDLDLNLNSAEVFKILGDRAKAKLEKKMGFTEFEFDLDGMLEKALKGKFRRDINMRLLDEKVHDQELKEHKSLLPSLIKKKKKPDTAAESTEIEGLPDMTKIIPGFEKPKAKSSSISETSIFGNKALPKLDLFGGMEKLDLQSLLSLLGSKATTEQSTTSTNKERKTEFIKKPDLYDKHDFERQFHVLEDDLNGGSFFDHFGDSISVHPKKSEENKKLRSGWDFDDTEFVIHDFSTEQSLNIFRRPRETKDQIDETPHQPNKIIKEYQPKMTLDDWRPEDMLKLPQLHSTYQVDEHDNQISFKDIPRSRSSFGLENAERINIRKARRVAGEIDSVENAIDGFFNTIETDTKFIKPLLDKEGEYTIVLPTREKLSLMHEANGDTELVLHRDAARMSVQTEQLENKDNQVDDSTCPATDLYPEETLKNAFEHAKHDASTNDGNSKITPKKTDDVQDVGEKRVNRSEYVQKIPLKSKKSKQEQEQETSDYKYNLGFVTKIVNSFSTFMKKLHKKMDSIFSAVE